MPQPSETAFDGMKADDRYKKRYMDRFELDVNAEDILANVVPNDVPDFFPGKACNIICLTGIYVDWDSTASVARLKATYNDFAKYELHIMIDGDAENITNSSSSQINDMIEQIEDLIADNELGNYGVVFHGKLSTSELNDKLRLIADAFYGIAAT